ncbi:flagellar assembly protein FliH [Sutcliffiella halmapala]|uniref:flagellar assembly protein FliH n=1 Tax=Sutcliffiella halmapala TaxID=79882 RepID=UPI001473E63F|nr:flagellar assembly protein FliH [Sutcliffiella halmapala]
MSRLIKSSFLKIEEQEKISIKVAPIFTQQEKEQQTVSNNHSIEHINNLVQEAKDEATKILEKATSERDRIYQNIATEKNNWVVEKQQWIDQATAQGYEHGFQQGKKEAISEFENHISEAKHVVELAKKEHDEKVNSSIETIMSLSIKVAEKIIGIELEKDTSSYLKLIQTALIEVKEKEDIRIYVNPKQYPLVIQNKPILQNIINSQYELLVFPDTALTEDGCWIDSSAGRMEVSVQTQLLEIKEKLLHLVKVGAKK